MSIKKETTRKKPAKKEASKKKVASKKKSTTTGRLARDMALTTVASIRPTAKAWRSDKSMRTMEAVPGYDPNAYDIPGHFEESAKALRIWPFYTKADARPFSCLEAHRENAPIYYDGGKKVYPVPYNAYHIAARCLDARFGPQPG